MKRLDSGVTIGNQTCYTFKSFHSLVVSKVAVLLVAAVKVDTVLEDVNGKVASTSDAVVKVANALDGGWISSLTRRGLGTEAFTDTSDRFDCWLSSVKIQGCSRCT